MVHWYKFTQLDEGVKLAKNFLSISALPRTKKQENSFDLKAQSGVKESKVWTVGGWSVNPEVKVLIADEFTYFLIKSLIFPPFLKRSPWV